MCIRDRSSDKTRIDQRLWRTSNKQSHYPLSEALHYPGRIQQNTVETHYILQTAANHRIVGDNTNDKMPLEEQSIFVQNSFVLEEQSVTLCWLQPLLHQSV